MYFLHILKTVDNLPKNVPTRPEFWLSVINNSLPLRLYCTCPKETRRDANTIVVFEFPHTYADTFVLQHACESIMTKYYHVRFAITDTV